jgi:GT2 family glycosyltransferase
VTAVLMPAMSHADAPDAAVGIWVGKLDMSVLQAAPSDRPLPLLHAEGYTRARLLVVAGGMPRGFVEVPVIDGAVPRQELRVRAATLPAVGAQPDVPLPQVSVVLCTRDRAEQLRVALASLLTIEYPDFEIIVVDNAPQTTASVEVVRSAADSRVRLVTEPHPGLARARNRGVLEARHDVVAFTDDDVAVDSGWLRGVAVGLARANGTGCVCGIVPSGEIRTASQAYFDKRVNWARDCAVRIFDLTAPPPGDPLFPFHVGEYGTGANFALLRQALHETGGFDEALGAGSATGGGEDIDMFVRVLLTGQRLVYEPSAIVWHRHRSDLAALREQADGYGRGLGAWLTKVMLDRRMAPLLLRRAAAAIRHARRMTDVGAIEAVPDETVRSLGRAELRALLSGPPSYLRARRSGARRAPCVMKHEGD